MIVSNNYCKTKARRYSRSDYLGYMAAKQDFDKRNLSPKGNGRKQRQLAKEYGL